MIEILNQYTGAVIYRSDLADVRAAVLQAVKKNVSLESANLRYANLRDADLQSADLQSADLQYADLQSANLRSANLNDDTGLPTGETFGDYKSNTLPALATAGGKSLAEVAAAWDCHTWANCPMHVAFGADSVHECPILLRPRVEQFVQLFDAGLLPKPEVTEAVPADGEVR